MVSILSTLYRIVQTILLQSILHCSSFRLQTPHVNIARKHRTLFRQTYYIVKTANAPTSPNPRYTFNPALVLVAALAFVADVLPPLLVPVAVEAVPVATPPTLALPAFVEGPGVCTGPAPLPPFQ